MDNLNLARVIDEQSFVITDSPGQRLSILVLLKDANSLTTPDLENVLGTRLFKSLQSSYQVKPPYKKIKTWVY